MRVIVAITIIFLGFAVWGGASFLSKSSEVFEFVESAEKAGVADRAEYGRGVAVVDVDGDGLSDIWDVDAGPADPDGENGTTLFRNLGGGVFEEFSIGIPKSALQFHWAGVWGDYDNDGDQDVLLVNGGYSGEGRLFLYENRLDTDGTFVDVSKERGITSEIRSWWSASWADYDNDGFLDFVVVPTSGEVLLYRNEGGSQFVEVGRQAGVNVSFADGKSPVWIDFDLDNDPDLYLGGVEKQILLENKEGFFEDITNKAFVDSGTTEPTLAFSNLTEDFNQDGYPDIYVGRFHLADKLFINQKDGTFRAYGVDIGLFTKTGFFDGENTMGLGVGDISGNGYPDILIGTGSREQGAGDIIFCNQGVGSGNTPSFRRCGGSFLFQNGVERTHGAVVADLDNDFDPDIFYNLGGSRVWDWERGDTTSAQNKLYLQSNSEGNYSSIRLVGSKSNRDAIGARVAVSAKGALRYYQVHSVQGFVNDNGKSILISLGEATEGQAHIFWPSGKESEYTIRSGESFVILEE